MSSSSILSGVGVARSPVFCMMLSVLQFKDYDYPSGGHEFILGSKWGLCRSISCLLGLYCNIFHYAQIIKLEQTRGVDRL